tara:strand:- start:485 stop:793 length:309 start_codon:yes stop_codon:yes gene_type:complete
MQSKNPFLNDFSKLLTGAFGLAQNTKVEIETALSAMLERWLSERNLVNREEFDVLKVMAEKADEKNALLEAKIVELEKQVKSQIGVSRKDSGEKKRSVKKTT